MPHTAYPTKYQLSRFIESLGVIDVDAEEFTAIDLNPIVAAAVQQWEQKTDWKPFLASATPQTRTYDPPGAAPRNQAMLSLRGGGRSLDLGGGLLSLTGLTVQSSGYELGVQFWLYPSDAPNRGEPYQTIEFLVPVYAQAQGIGVTGIFGYSEQVPDDAWNAILVRAASLVSPQIDLQITRGKLLKKYADLEIRYAGGGVESPLAAQRAVWDANFDRTAKTYKRL